MRSFTAPAYIAALLSGQTLAISTWQVAFWSGEDCTSAPVQADKGPDSPQFVQVCNSIPDLGTTQSFDYEVANGKDTYTLGLHKTNDCSDNGGRFQGTPDTPTCETTSGGFTHYSITTNPSVSKREENIDDLRTISPTNETVELEKRQALTFAQFTLAAAVPATSWIDKTVTRCFGTADDNNVEKGSCGLATTYSVIFSLITGYGAYGVYQARQNVQKRDAADLNNTLTVGDVAEWLTDSLRPQDQLPQIVPGYTITINRLGFFEDDNGAQWHNFYMKHTEVSSAEHFGALFKYNKHTLGKRASKKYTAYYAWYHGANVQSLPSDKPTSKHLAEQVYNFGKDKNEAQFCADLRAGINAGSLTREITTGNYALLTGTFSDKKAKC